MTVEMRIFFMGINRIYLHMETVSCGLFFFCLSDWFNSLTTEIPFLNFVCLFDFIRNI